MARAGLKHPPRASVANHTIPTDTSLDLVDLLATVALVANGDDEPLVALQAAVERIGELVGWQVGHAYLVDPAGTLETTETWWHEDGVPLKSLASASRRRQLSHDVGLPGRVLASGGPEWIADLEADGNFPRAAAAKPAGLRAAFAFPIQADGEVVAILEFFSRELLAPDEEFLATIATVGTQLGRVFERASARRDLQDAADRSQQILDGATDAFIATDAAGLITGWNDQAELVFGWTRAEAIGQQVSTLIIPEAYRADHDAGVRRFLETETPHVMGQRLELEGLRKSGEIFPIEMSFWALRIGDSWAFHSFGRDISARKQREANLAFRALHDELTGLANRTLITDRIEQALARRTRSGNHVAVMLCDLDRFKVINDSLGHAVGDRLLKAVAETLRGAVRAVDTVGRVAGDEFVVVCEDLDEPAEAMRVAQRVLEALATPIELGDDRLRARASIGIALASRASATAEDLLRDASAAMSRSKEYGRGRIKVFDDRMRKHIRSRLRTEVDLAAGIERDELRLHYQPIVALDDDHVVGVEALVRWEHPKRGLLPPGKFIPLAEETGLIVPIGAWVLEQACRQAQRWQQQGASDLSIAVNLSERQLSREGFVDATAAVLERAGLDRSRVRVEFELTESLLMSDPDYATTTLGRLRDLGFRLSIDDFGTGYSSLGYLKHFPVDVIKIDRSFIIGLASDSRDLALVTAIAELGHALELSVLAEGVETSDQRDLLARIGCDLAQGYYFAKPAPAEEIAPLLGLSTAAAASVHAI